jgi:hypothetical protein
VVGKYMDNGKLKDLLGLGGLEGFSIPKIKPVTPSFEAFNPNRKEYHSPEEILDEDNDEFERPDFSNWTCNICGESIEDGYFWYYIRDERDESNSIAVCSKECLDKLLKNGSYHDYEIYEYSRCTAYHKCEELGNLRGMCETAENKSYQSIIPLISRNYCEPAQAGIILSTHKLTEVLKNFSKQTEEQYLSNKETMAQGARESTKQFKITTWMTILVIILTIVNLVPTFLNLGGNNYSEQLTSIESKLSNIKTSDELNQIENKIDEVTRIISNGLESEDSRIIELLESIQNELKVLSRH